nr:hydrolase yhcx [Quercus suber]
MQMEHNFAKAADFIRAAALQKAQLAVLPEYHLLNWLPHDEKFKEACSHWETYLMKYRDLAKECNINIVPGTLVELHDAGTEDERLLNVAYFITNTGAIAGKYVKKNLWGPIERLHLTSSSTDEHPVFDTPLGKVGMLICWDLAFPEAFREMISKGAKIIHSLTPLSLAVIFANAGGPPGKGYAGLSQVCVPYAGALTRLGSSAEGMAVVDLDMQIVEDAEENYQVRADLARSDWHYEYRHNSTSGEKGDAKL